MSACPSATPVWRFRLLRRFADDRSGAVAIIFALSSIVVIFAIVGGAVDYARWVYSRNQMQAALDAGAGRRARYLQLNSGNAAAAVEAANATYRSMRSKHIASEDI